MKRWVHRLGSIKLAIGLLVVVLLALAAGTIVESMQGGDAARQLVYDAPWFRILAISWSATTPPAFSANTPARGTGALATSPTA